MRQGLVLAALTTMALSAAPALAADKVRVGNLNTIGDITVFIAQDKGYFAREGIDPEVVLFDASAKMIAPLGTGELDVGGGATAVGLFNAIDRGIGLRVVADKGRTEAGYVYQSLVIRKDLIDGGKFRGYADLKGLKIAVGAPGVGPLAALNELGKAGGVAYADIEKVFLAFPQQVAALRSGAIDGAVMNEPYKTLLRQQGLALEFAPTQDVYPDYEVSLALFGEKFRRDRADVSRRYLRAVLRAARDYNDAIANGRWKTDGSADEAISIFAKRTNQPVELIRAITPPAIDPDGEIKMGSLRKDLAFFQEQGDVGNKALTADQCVDLTMTREVARELGPYTPRK
jgi:NitT/TauT family transport system substrate-binding protein